MAQNSLYPGFVRLHYAQATKKHVMVVPVKPYFSAGSAWWIQGLASPANDSFWQTATNAFIQSMQPLFHSTVTFSLGELWTIASVGADPVFVDSFTPTFTGSSAGAVNVNSQAVMTFRSENGGLYRLYMMETSVPNNTVAYPPAYTGATGFAAVATAVMANTSMVKARDGGHCIASLRAVTKTNDMLRQKFLLDV